MSALSQYSCITPKIENVSHPRCIRPNSILGICNYPDNRPTHPTEADMKAESL